MVPHCVRSQGVYKGLWICAFHPNVHTNTCVHMDAHACACTHTHTHMHACVYTYTHMYTHTHPRTCTHSRAYMHAHTHTHTHTHSPNTYITGSMPTPGNRTATPTKCPMWLTTVSRVQGVPLNHKTERDKVRAWTNNLHTEPRVSPHGVFAAGLVTLAQVVLLLLDDRAVGGILLALRGDGVELHVGLLQRTGRC